MMHFFFHPVRRSSNLVSAVRMDLWALLCILAACYGSALALNATSDEQKGDGKDITPLLLVSFDGFRADYLEKYPLPNMQKFFSDGVLIDHLTNVFTTKTFPNHYSLATGLYAESHGILASRMYDPETKKVFTVRNSSDPFWWNEATPIWVSVQDRNYKSAAAMWPGTDVMIQNRTATYFLKYNSKVRFNERLNNLTKWLTQDNLVKFAALYWEEPDNTGHIYGPENATMMAKALKEVDDQVGFLMNHLNQTGLWGKINVIITSDHGMVQCSQDRLIKLDDCVDRMSYMLVDTTPVAAIIPLNGGYLLLNIRATCCVVFTIVLTTVCLSFLQRCQHQHVYVIGLQFLSPFYSHTGDSCKLHISAF